MWARHHSRVGNASLACTRTRSRSVLACDIACDASRSHSFVKLHLGGTVVVCYFYSLVVVEQNPRFGHKRPSSAALIRCCLAGKHSLYRVAVLLIKHRDRMVHFLSIRMLSKDDPFSP